MIKTPVYAVCSVAVLGLVGGAPGVPTVRYHGNAVLLPVPEAWTTCPNETLLFVAHVQKDSKRERNSSGARRMADPSRTKEAARRPRTV